MQGGWLATLSTSPRSAPAVVISTAVVGRTTGEGDGPPWFEWVNISQPYYCACVPVVKHYIVCDQENQTTSLRQASCMFYNSDIADVVAAKCPLFFPKSVIKDNLSPLPRKVTELYRFVCGSLSREETVESVQMVQGLQYTQ